MSEQEIKDLEKKIDALYNESEEAKKSGKPGDYEKSVKLVYEMKPLQEQLEQKRGTAAGKAKK